MCLPAPQRGQDQCSQTWKAHVIAGNFHYFSNIFSEYTLKSSRGSFSPWIKTTAQFQVVIHIISKEHQCEDKRSSERFTLFTRVRGNVMHNPEFVHCSSNKNEDSTTSTYNAEDSPKSFYWVSCISYFKMQTLLLESLTLCLKFPLASLTSCVTLLCGISEFVYHAAPVISHLVCNTLCHLCLLCHTPHDIPVFMFHTWSVIWICMSHSPWCL